MDGDGGLVFAYVVDGSGGGRALSWDEVRSWQPADGVLWIHLDYKQAEAERWLVEDSGLDEVTREGLLAEAPRPRSVPVGDGLLIIMRVINLNEGAQPEDMVSVRIWIDAHRVIMLRHRRVNAAKAERDALLEGRGPINSADLLVDFTNRTLDRIGRVVTSIDDSIDALEDEVLSGTSHEMRHRLSDFRRQTIALRRYIAPQRDLLGRLHNERCSWLDDVSRGRLREAADRMTRMVEDLDAARDRASVTQEELSSRLSEMMNQRLYVLSLVAAIFLPLGLVTGILGVNLGGIPGMTLSWGFWAMCGGLIGLSGVQLWLFRRWKWL